MTVVPDGGFDDSMTVYVPAPSRVPAANASVSANAVVVQPAYGPTSATV